MNFKKVLAVLMAAMMLMASGVCALAAEEPQYVAVIAGTDVKVTDLNDAFDLEKYPYSDKSVILLSDYEGDVTVTGGYRALYLNGYTINGKLTVDGATIYLNGHETSNKVPKGPHETGVITNTGLDGNYPIHHTVNGGNLNINEGLIKATGENGVALLAEGNKVNIQGDKTCFEGAVKAEGFGIINISGGTFSGKLDKEIGAQINISAGTYTEDPSSLLSVMHKTEDADGKYKVVERTDLSVENDLKYDDTEGVYLIENATDLKLFRLLLNKESKSLYSGMTFKIVNDIDLQGEPLPAVGSDSSRFAGTIDGNYKTISNLVVHDENASHVGLIGLSRAATIKNLTIHNADIKGYDYVAPIVGYARYGATDYIENCHVTGVIKCEGTYHVAGAVGGGDADITNCSVKGEEGSYVKGDCIVGGITSLSSAGSDTISGNSIEGIDISAENGVVGGIVGWAQTSDSVEIANNSAKNITITSKGNDATNAALITSAIKFNDNEAEVKFSNNNAEECVLTVNGEEKTDLYTGIEQAATVEKTDGSVEVYTSFAEALKNANVTGNTITLGTDAELANLPAISPGNALYASIDLNGNTLTVKQDSITPHGVPENPVTIKNGKLVINDITTGSSGVFWAKQGVDLILDNVEVVSNNVKSTALFATENGSDIEIKNSKFTVDNFEGTAVFSNLGECVIDNTEIAITDSNSAGFLQKATIQNGSSVTMTNVTEGIKLGTGTMEIKNSDVKVDGAFSGITLYEGTTLKLSEGADVVIANATIGVYNRSEKTTLNVENGSTLTKESTITIDETVTVGGTDISLPGLKNLLEAYVEANPAYKAEGEVLFTVKADVYTPQVPVGKEGQTVEYFDIMPVIGDEEVVLPAGTTQNVQITLGEKVEGEAEVYHYVGDKWESVTATTSGNTVTFAASSFSPYAVAYKSVALEESEAAKSITAEIVPTTDERVYDVVVKADALKINRFRSAELDINFAGDKGMNYKVEGVGNVQVILPETSNKTVYEFNLNGTGANFITSEYITIAQVKIFGHGSATLKLEENEFNMVYATQGGTETVEEIFTPANNDAKLTVNTEEIEINIAPEEKILKVQVKFDKNTISDNANEYQQLYVRIYGGDLEEDIVYNLGNGSGEVELSDNVYTMSTPLRMGLIYNVEVSGAGYRTYDHQVIMTGNKELTFWNNLKGGANDPEIKIDKDAEDTAKRAWTLLEGDVVMDYTVDIYDLSAVVSYFNRTFTPNTTDGNKYAAYDLNRDGKIDAVDIGRVLNSWGK